MDNLIFENLKKELERLEDFSEIIGVAIANRNGLLISSKLPRDIDERKFAAMAATMFSGIETALSALENEQINNFTVEFNDNQLIILGINEKAIIVVLLNYNVNLGLIFIEIEESIKNIQKILNR
ncbi:MAG: roadblock/LC7 domain-containing protein [Promethearchaeota archaeon]|nr:MAG: roadblock/LC7 domain-containing protein [Candidatus Lokiarchaeota archaeon]